MPLAPLCFIQKAVGLRLTLAVSLIGGLTLFACGGEQPQTAPPEIPSIAGTWTFNASNLSGGGFSCDALAYRLSVNQSGTTFTGSYSGGTIRCTGDGKTVEAGPLTGTIVNGTVTESGSVSFDLDTQDFHQTGTVSGDSMSGTATWRFDFSGILSGSWGQVPSCV